MRTLHVYTHPEPAARSRGRYKPRAANAWRQGVLARTPFRAALALSALIVLACTLGALLGARLLEEALSERLDIAAQEHFGMIGEAHASGGQAALVARIERYASVKQGVPTLYQLRGSDGALLAGKPVIMQPPPGLSAASGEALGAPETARYRVMRGKVGDMDLVVGLSDARNDEIRRLVHRVALLATLASLGVVLGGGLWLADRAQRRLEHIGMSLERVGAGELSARVPLSGRGDDIDVLATRVNTMLEKLESLVAAGEQMSTDIAHDLKTPIGHLFLSLEEALADAADGRDVTERLLDAQTELVDINAIFEALLRLSRIERGARRARFADVALAELLARVLEHWAPVAEAKGQTLEFDDRTHGTAIVSGDSDLLTQLVVNLVTNSLGHCPRDARVALVLESSATGTIIRVADDGPGIPPTERDKVFRRLYRLDRSRSTPGYGLGLSLVKAISALHGGTVTLSDNAPGLLVTVELPWIERACAAPLDASEARVDASADHRG